MERPHPPSPRRRALARAAGRVLVSPAGAAALALAAGTAATIAVVAGVAGELTDATREQLAHATDDGGVARAIDGAGRLPLATLAIVAPIAAAAAIGGLLGQAVLARGLWVPRREVRGAPDAGAEATTVAERAGEAALTVARALLVLGVAIAVTVARLPRLAPLAAAPAPAAAWLGLVATAAATAAVAAIATSLIDVAWRYHRLRSSLAMTTREWREDARESSGDPRWKRAARDAQRDDRALVADARVVIAGDAVAVALAWQPGSPPRVTHRGRGLAAHRLRNAARAARVPLHADPALAERLAGGAAVPEDALPAVAELLAACGVSA
ncbi:MAG: EscU/YscU/HrcU family type III secretion system export apparatus switch protein [Myxococcales bacterium]|nr:EscU/YscU/HrcU family type III secretion system export apparatus switch protein [Myxococcales bacterium]